MPFIICMAILLFGASSSDGGGGGGCCPVDVRSKQASPAGTSSITMERSDHGQIWFINIRGCLRFMLSIVGTDDYLLH